MKDFLCINDFTGEKLLELLELSKKLKALYARSGHDLCLSGKTVALLFEKPSLRTRISFQVAVADLGASSIYVRGEDHKAVAGLAEFAAVPVINALTDWSHPCQAMADVLTVSECFGRLEGIRIAFVGDGNNVARSLAFACAKLGMKIVVASPAGYELDNESIRRANAVCDGSVRQVNKPAEAVADADVIYTDTWVSMGQEQEKQKRMSAFAGFQVNRELLEHAPRGAKIMHCLPAYRGCEITEEAVESPDAVILQQAENRLHFQRALLKQLAG